MFDRVTKGSEFQPDAEKENKLTEMLNQFQQISGKRIPGFRSRNICLPVFWYGNENYPANEPIEVFTMPSDGLFEVTEPSSNECFWGVTKSILLKGIVDEIILEGVVQVYVTIMASAHRYAKLSGKQLVSCAEKTRCRILHNPQSPGSQLCWCLLSAMAEKTDEYNGPFKVTVSSDNKLNVSKGYINRNGTFDTVPEKTGITADTGELCVCSTIDGKTLSWITPEIKIATPSATAYPIAGIKCEKDGDTVLSVSVTPYYCSVAVIIVAKPCATAKIQQNLS